MECPKCKYSNAERTSSYKKLINHPGLIIFTIAFPLIGLLIAAEVGSKSALVLVLIVTILLIFYLVNEYKKQKFSKIITWTCPKCNFHKTQEIPITKEEYTRVMLKMQQGTQQADIEIGGIKVKAKGGIRK